MRFVAKSLSGQWLLPFFTPRELIGIGIFTLLLVALAAGTTEKTQAQPVGEYSKRLQPQAYVVVWNEAEVICAERPGSQSKIVECMSRESYLQKNPALLYQDRFGSR